MPKQWWEDDTYADVEDWEDEFYIKRRSYYLPLSYEDRRSIVDDCKKMKEKLELRLQFPSTKDSTSDRDRIMKLIDKLDSIRY